MKIYTKTGDKGQTGLYGGDRVLKTSARIAAIGDLDELNAAIGLARSAGELPLLEELQSWLFDLGAVLASPSGGKFSPEGPGEAAISQMESSIDAMAGQSPPLSFFVLPGGVELASRLHLARCICRRAERSALALHEKEPLPSESLVFLNRLSDWLFAAARLANVQAGVEDVPWRKTGGNQA